MASCQPSQQQQAWPLSPPSLSPPIKKSEREPHVEYLQVRACTSGLVREVSRHPFAE